MHLLDLLFPPVCVQCGKIGRYICRDCAAVLRPFTFGVCPACDRPTADWRTHLVCRTPYGLDGLIVAADYKEPLRSLVTAIKYGGLRDAGRATYEMFHSSWPTTAPKFDVLVPVPLHPKRLRERGYNQAEVLAQQVARTCTSNVDTTILIKVRETTSQAGKDRDARLKLEQPFICLHPSRIQEKIVGIVDDVATTRTTLRLAAEALKKAGAKEVWGVALAHPY